MYLFMSVARPMLAVGRTWGQTSEVAMRIEVMDQGVQVSEAVRDYARLRLMSMLDHLARHVGHVTIYLTDVASSAGHTERRCRMFALVSTSGQTCAEAVDSAVYPAIDRAAERLAHGVAVQLGV